MTTFEALILFAVIAIEIIFAIHSNCVIKKIKENNYTQSGLDSKLQSILDVCIQQESEVNTILQQLKELYSQHCEFESNAENALVVTADKIKELVDFEKRNEQRNDEMFTRCEEINKLQLAELKARVHTGDAEPFPPKDVVGVTSTGICQECNGKNECEYFDVNRNRCFVADRKED